MDSEIEEVVVNPLAKPDDAGNRNKMASSCSTPINKGKSVEHELKIMEVEGAVTANNSETIELADDDADFVSVDLVTELQDALNVHEKPVDDALQEEELSAKKERHSEVDGNGSYNGPDPMGLLEPIDTSKDVDVEDNEVDVDDDSSDEASSSDSRGVVRHDRWQNWMKRYPWLLHEESDGSLAFCLYCNVVINVNKNLKNIQQHNISLYHQEREVNYLAFKNSDEQKRNSSNDVEVKHEFGTDSYVAAMKVKRARDVEKLNNFNWQRWLNWHEWLERFQNEGTLGLCKYCNIRMNVEFVYLRKRHETSKGHCEAQRSHDKQTRKRKHSDTQENNTVEANNENNNENNNTTQIDDPNIMTVVVANIASTDPTEMCELLPDTNPPQCRCTLCDCRMAITSFTRHLKTKLHCTNVTQQKQTAKVNRGVFAKYANEHPWLVADPLDESLAYCSICCKRFMYGHSEIKRKNHENSEKHNATVAAAAAAAANAGENQENEQSEPEPSEAQSESENNSDDDYIHEDDKLSTSRRSSVEQPDETTEAGKTEPVVRHFSWLRYSKDRKVQLCKYCRVRFFNDSGKLRHEHSARHKKLVLQFKARKAAQYKQRKEAANEREQNEKGDEEAQSNAESAADTIQDNVSEDQSTSTKPVHKVAHKQVPLVPSTMQGKVMVWKDRFPWLSYKRSEERHNYGWCKLCEVSVFLPSFKYASKHQRSSRHVRLRFERKRTGGNLNVKMSASPAAAPLVLTGEAKHRAAMAELQSKYDWLEPDASDENYCHCKLCETRLPIKVFFLRQHDGSRKHAEQLERIRNQSEVSSRTAATSEQMPSVMDVDQDSDEALSVNPLNRSECSTEGQPPSKRMRRSLEVRRILRVLRDSMGKRIEQPPERSQLDMAKDMISSSFDIVSRLRTLERENISRDFPPQTSPYHNASLIASPTQAPRHTIDLFFESITQTMKSMPADLAAEGKAKIMQIVCELELRGMQRNAPIQPDAAPAAKEMPAKSSTESVTIDDDRRSNANFNNFDEVINVSAPGSPESNRSTITVEDLTLEPQPPAQSNQSSHINNPTKLPEVTRTSNQRTTITVSNPSPSVMTSTASRMNGQNKEVPLTVRCILPSSLQVAHASEVTNDSLRVVPINKLTKPNAQNPINNARNTLNGTSNMMQRNSGGHSSPNAIGMNTPNSSLHSDMSNGTSGGSGGSAAMYSKIRVNNGTTSKLITVQKQPQQQMHSQPKSTTQQQQQQHQQQSQQSHAQSQSHRYSNSGVHLTPIQIQAQQQLQAQAQLRSLNNNRTVVRAVPASSNRQQQHQ